MCLIVFAWQLMPASPLVAAANRDEYYDRPAASAQWWEDHPQVYAGRDLQGGGTWMGVTKCSRFAAITNVRAPSEFRCDAPSRGALVKNYLASEMTPQEYVEKIVSEPDPFNGYNLLIGNRDTLIWYSNRGQSYPLNGKPLQPGIYGLSNALLERSLAQSGENALRNSPACSTRTRLKKPTSTCYRILHSLPIRICQKPASTFLPNACSPLFASTLQPMAHAALRWCACIRKVAQH